MKIIKLFILIYIVGFSTALTSQENTNLETFVVTAQYKKTPQEKSINKVKVIDKEKIDAIGAVNLKDVLLNETNIRINQDNVLGSSMSIQGLSGQNVKILIDGVPIIGRLNGNIDLSQINLNNVERIEIVEGPLAVNYGTNALAGTINIITQKKFSKKYSLSLNNYAETVGQYNTDLFVGYQIKNSSLGLSFGKYFFDGWDPSDPIYETPRPRTADTNRNKEWNPKDQEFLRLDYNLVLDSQSLRLYVNLYKEKITNRGKPRNPYFESAFDDYYNTLRKDVGLDYKKSFKNSQLKILSSFNHYKRIKNTFYNDLTTLEEQLTMNSSDQDTILFTQLMSRGNITKNLNKIDFQVGYDFNHQSSEGKRIKADSNNLTDLALFGSFEYKPVKNIILKPAIRVSYNNHYQIKNRFSLGSLDFQHPLNIQNYVQVLPSFNLKYEYGNLIFRTSYGKGFRSPSLKELYFNFVDINHNIIGNTNLQAEYSNNFTANLQWKNDTKFGNIKIDGGGFFNDVKNLITLATSENNSQQYTYVNIGEFKTIGAQINTTFNFKPITLKIGLAHIGRYNNLTDKQGISLFNFSPELRSNIIYELENYPLRFSAFYKYNGQLNGFYMGNNDEILESIIDDYHHLDFNITRNFKEEKIFWTIGAKNLFNVQSVNTTSSSGVHTSNLSSVPINWGRSFFTSLKFKLN